MFLSDSYASYTINMADVMSVGPFSSPTYILHSIVIVFVCLD